MEKKRKEKKENLIKYTLEMENKISSDISCHENIFHLRTQNKTSSRQLKKTGLTEMIQAER